METKRPANETIQIGDVFKHTSDDECGSACSFYQVVGKRGKTLVELRAIRGEEFVDETCKLEYGEVRVRPLPGQFLEDKEVFTVRACGPNEATGRNWLRKRGETSRVFGTYYSQVLEGELGRLSGFDGHYVIRKMKKEGKLPPWAKWHEK